ncbi:MAG: hypothetical protein ACNA8W_17875 [Bradymonadaceae bacterium]
MQLSDAFAPDLSPDDVFLDRIPRLHEERRVQFRQFVDCPLIFSFRFTDTDRSYTVELDEDEARSEKGEMIDFPLATVEGRQADWEAVKFHLLELLEEADRRADEYVERVGINAKMIEQFERFDGVIDITFRGARLDHPIAMRVILNDYEPVDDARSFAVDIPIELLFSVVRGEVPPSEAAKSLRIKGEMGFALELGGFFLKHLKDS